MNKTVAYIIFFVILILPISAQNFVNYIETGSLASIGLYKNLAPAYWAEFNQNHGVELKKNSFAFDFSFGGQYKKPISAISGILLRPYISFSTEASLNFYITPHIFVKSGVGANIGQYSGTELFFFYPSSHIRLYWDIWLSQTNNSKMRLAIPLNFEFREDFSIIGATGITISFAYSIGE